MAFQKFVQIPHVVDLKSTEKNEAIEELTRILLKTIGVKKQKPVVDDILKRETAASTFIGQGIAIPFTRHAIKTEFAIAVGRNIEGIGYDAARGASAHIIVLVIARDDDNEKMVELRSEIASFFKAELVRERLLSPEPVAVKDLAIASADEDEGATGSARPKKTFPIIDAALELAKDVRAKSIVFLADAVRDTEFLKHIGNTPLSKRKVIIITSNKSRFNDDDKRISSIIQAPPFPSSRTGQLKVGILLALSRELVSRNDTIVCVSGMSRHGQFDTVVAISIEKEYEFFFSESMAILPPDVKPEVLERIMGLANEIAAEGREGKPTGTIFVVGDSNSVNANVRQLIINPFRGYSEAERNILDPALEETIKEFASINGAFIITGDGIITSAGSYLRPPVDTQTVTESLPGGLGARHAAAAGITACTNALAITISESTGMVSLFKNGIIMLSLSKPAARSARSGTRLMTMPEQAY